MKDLFNYYSEEDSEERCGLVLISGEILELKNIHPEPSLGFEIDPEAIISYLAEMKATWHTHPKANSILSGEDHLCFSTWPDLDHYIIGKDGVRMYTVEEGAVIDADYLPR